MPEDAPPPMSESAALAILCERLTVLRSLATVNGWRDQLETEIDHLKAGGSPLAVCRRLGLLPSSSGSPTSETRGDSTTVTIPGLDPVIMRGDHVCPHRPACLRHAGRDANGHPPRCSVSGEPMPFRSRT